MPTSVELTLSRFLIGPQGAFSDLLLNGEKWLKTCERVFDELGASGPVVPAGTYRCVRGTHRLADSVSFETFEVTGVDGHSGILFHRGNTELDSRGCILVGKFFDYIRGAPGVWASGEAFKDFIGKLEGIEEFVLTVNNDETELGVHVQEGQPS